MSLIKALQVSARYGATQVLCDASIQVEVGETIAITGASGAGKSTFLKILSGNLRPSGGKLLVHNKNFWSLPYDTQSSIRLQSFGMVTQDSDLFPELTIIENVALPNRLAEISAKSANTRAGEVLESLGILEIEKKFPNQISGGQKQRAAIARAIINNPKVIFADEPTGSLDPNNSAIVMEVLKDAAKSTNSALIVVTHSSSVANQLDRQIVVQSFGPTKGARLKNG